MRDKLEEKTLVFELFCLNAQIQIQNKKVIANGIQLLVAANGMTAYMNIYNNGNTQAQGCDSALLHVLQLWEGHIQAPEFLAPGVIPDLYMGWKDWKEDRDTLTDYHKTQGIPQEEYAADDYKSIRERMFHDFMFRTASNRKKIHIEKVRFVVNNWMKHYCFMQIDAKAFMQDFYTRITSQYASYIEEYLVPFDIIVSEITYVMDIHCAWKLIGEERHCGYCPLPGRDYCDCLIKLVDAMYVYCEDQSVIAYTKSNLTRLLNSKYDEVTWHTIQFNSPIEELMANGLASEGLLTIPQFQACAPAHKYRVDFVIKTNSGWSIAVECDGLEYHATPAQYTRDRQRDRILQEHGFYMMRFSSVDIFNNLPGCIEDISRTFWKMQKGKMNYQTYRPLSYFGNQ